MLGYINILRLFWKKKIPSKPSCLDNIYMPKRIELQPCDSAPGQWYIKALQYRYLEHLKSFPFVSLWTSLCAIGTSTKWLWKLQTRCSHQTFCSIHCYSDSYNTVVIHSILKFVHTKVQIGDLWIHITFGQ